MTDKIQVQADIQSLPTLLKNDATIIVKDELVSSALQMQSKSVSKPLFKILNGTTTSTNKYSEVLSQHFQQINVPVEDISKLQCDFADFKQFIGALNKEQIFQLLSKNDVKVNIDLKKPSIGKQNAISVDELTKIIYDEFDLEQIADAWYEKMSEAEKIKLLTKKNAITHQETPRIQAFMTLSQLCGQIKLEESNFNDFSQKNREYSKNWLQSPQFLFSLFKDMQLVTLCDTGCSEFTMTRLDRMNTDHNRVIENYMVPKEINLKRIDEVVPISTEYEQIMINDMARYSVELKATGTDSDLMKLQAENYLQVPFELMDVIHFYMQQGKTAKQGLMEFGVKLGREIQKTMFITLLQTNCFCVAPFNWVEQYLKKIFGENYVKKTIQTITEDQSTQLYSDLLPHNIIQYVVQDQQLYHFLLQRVCITILKELLIATPKPNLSVEVQKNHNYLRPHFMVINKCLQMICYLNAKLTNSEENPLYIPTKFITKEYMPDTQIAVNGQQIAFDHHFSITLGSHFQKIKSFLPKLIAQKFITPKNPIYQAKLDTILGDFSDFSVYRDITKNKIAVINPFQQITIMFESQHLNNFETTMADQIESSVMIHSAGFNQWMNLQTACQPGQMVQLFNKLTSKNIKIESDDDKEFEKFVKKELVEDLTEKLIKLLSKSMSGCYPTNPAEPYEIQKISKSKQLKLLESQFEYVQKLKNPISRQQINEYSLQVTSNFVKSLFKYDLMQLGFEFLHTQLRLSNTVNTELQGLCECLYTVLVCFNLTDDAFGGSMQTFIDKLAQIQKSAKNLQNNEISEIMMNSIQNYITIFATFEHNWAKFDSFTGSVSLLNFVQGNKFSEFDLIEQMQVVGEQIDGIFRNYDLQAVQLSRVSYQVDDKFALIRYIQKFFKMYDIVDMHMLDALNYDTFPSCIPKVVIDTFIDFKKQGQRLQKQVKNYQGVTSLILTAQQQFFIKKRLFWFVITPNCMECHSYKQQLQNKNLQQTLTSNKTRYADLLFKFGFQRLFQQANTKYDGSYLVKQQICQLLMKVCIILEPYSQKSQFQKLLNQMMNQCNVKLSQITQELVDVDLINAVQNFAFAFFTFHVDIINHVFNSQDGTIRQMDCDYKKVQQNLSQSQKKFTEMFNYQSTSTEPFQLEAENSTLLNLYNFMIDELSTKSSQKILFVKEDFNIITLSDMIKFQAKNVTVVGEYREIVKETPKEIPKEVTINKQPEIQGEQIDEVEAKQILEKQEKKKDKKSKKDKEKEKKEKDRKKKQTTKRVGKESSSESEDQTTPNVEVEEPTVIKAEVIQPKIEVQVKPEPQIEVVVEQKKKVEPIQIEILTTPKPIDIQIPKIVEETIDPNLQWTGDTRLTTKILKEQLKLQKVFNIIPSKISSLNEQVRQLHSSVMFMINQLNMMPNVQVTAKFNAIFPMNPLDYLTLINGKQGDSMFVSLENITAKQAMQYIKLFNAFNELYLITLGHIIMRLDQKYFKYVNVKMDGEYFKFRLKQARSLLDDEGRELLNELTFGIDYDELYIPFIVGPQADYAKCTTYDSVGCNLQWKCGHSISSWLLMGTIYEQFKPYASLKNVQFREHFFNMLRQFGQICPQCNTFGFMQRLCRQSQVLGTVDKQQQINERMMVVDENDPERKIVVEIGGVGYLATIESCCWINQYLDEWII